jgi:hypothetical protein
MENIQPNRFTSADDRELILEYKTTNKRPESMSLTSYYRKRKLWDLLTIKDSKIYLDTKLLVSEEDIDEFLTILYKDPLYRRNNVQLFFNNVMKFYIGISRRRVQTFLNNIEGYQLSKQQNRNKVNRPIVISKAERYYQMDIIDMKEYSRQNAGIRWLLNIIDCNSKFVYIITLKTREIPVITSKVETFINNLETRPHIFQADNEFRRPELIAMFKKYNIELINSASYNPQAQGQIERFNGTIKNMIYDHMRFTNSNKYIDKLDDLLKNYNNSKHKTTHFTPQEMLSSKRDQRAGSANIVEAAEREVSKSRIKYSPLSVGNDVRIRLNDESKDVRKNIFHNAMNRTWSSNIFTISKIVENSVGRITYRLYYVEGKSKSFLRHNLQLVDKNTLLQIHSVNERSAAKERIRREAVHKELHTRRTRDKSQKNIYLSLNRRYPDSIIPNL